MINLLFVFVRIFLVVYLSYCNLSFADMSKLSISQVGNLPTLLIKGTIDIKQYTSPGGQIIVKNSQSDTPNMSDVTVRLRVKNASGSYEDVYVSVPIANNIKCATFTSMECLNTLVSVLKAGIRVNGYYEKQLYYNPAEESAPFAEVLGANLYSPIITETVTGTTNKASYQYYYSVMVYTPPKPTPTPTPTPAPQPPKCNLTVSPGNIIDIGTIKLGQVSRPVFVSFKATCDKVASYSLSLEKGSGGTYFDDSGKFKFSINYETSTISCKECYKQLSINNLSATAAGSYSVSIPVTVNFW